MKNVDGSEEKQKESLLIGMMSSQKSCSKSWYESLILQSSVDHSTVAFKIDTVVQTNAVKVLNTQIMPSNIKLKGYNNALSVNHSYV